MAQKPIYLDATQSVETRVNDLIRRMTIDEKINQMYSWGYNQVTNLDNILNKYQGKEADEVPEEDRKLYKELVERGQK